MISPCPSHDPFFATWAGVLCHWKSTKWSCLTSKNHLYSNTLYHFDAHASHTFERTPKITHFKKTWKKKELWNWFWSFFSPFFCVSNAPKRHVLIGWLFLRPLGTFVFDCDSALKRASKVRCSHRFCVGRLEIQKASKEKRQKFSLWNFFLIYGDVEIQKTS